MIELDIVAIITNVSNDLNSVVNALSFLYRFFDLLSLSLIYVIIFLMLLIELSNELTSFSFFLIVVLNQYFLMVQMGKIYLFLFHLNSII